MFILDVDMLEIEAAMFAHGRGVIADIEIWHMCIEHMNTQKD